MTPAFLLRVGVRAGEWKFVTQAQLRAIMRPETQDPAMRVYACGLLHTLTGKGSRRLATRYEGGKELPLRAKDIAEELNELDTLGRMDERRVRKLLCELEARGLVRRSGKPLRGERRLHFYTKPLRSRNVESEPEEPSLGVWPDPQITATHSNRRHLLDAISLTLRSGLVKTFRRAARSLLNGAADEGLEERVKEAESRLIAAAEAELQALCAATCPEPVVAEAEAELRGLCAALGESELPAEAAEEVSQPDRASGLRQLQPAPAAPIPMNDRAWAPLSALRRMFRSPIADEALQGLDGRIAGRLGADYPRAWFVDFVERWLHEKAQKRKTFGTGILFGTDSSRGLWLDFAEHEYPRRRAEEQEAEAWAEQCASGAMGPEALRTYLEAAATRLAGRNEYSSVSAALSRLAADAAACADVGQLEDRLELLEREMVAIGGRTLSPDALRLARADIEPKVQPYRGKMSSAQLADIEQQWLNAWIRDNLDLPRLSVLHLR